MKIGEEEAKNLFEEIMLQCKSERKRKTSRTLRQLAKELDTTENYLSAVENGREVPSFKLFLNYLLVNGFDIQTLRHLEIRPRSKELEKELKEKIQLSQRIYSLNSDQVDFLTKQADMAEQYGVRKLIKKK